MSFSPLSVLEKGILDPHKGYRSRISSHLLMFYLLACSQTSQWNSWRGKWSHFLFPLTPGLFNLDLLWQSFLEGIWMWYRWIKAAEIFIPSVTNLVPLLYHLLIHALLTWHFPILKPLAGPDSWLCTEKKSTGFQRGLCLWDFFIFHPGLYPGPLHIWSKLDLYCPQDTKPIINT